MSTMMDDLDSFNAAIEANAATIVRHPAAPPVAETAPQPFTALGHDRGRYFFYTGEGRQVVSLNARDLHTAGELVQLAPLRWWEGAYPGGRESFLVRAAGDALMRACYAAGVYDPDRLRGRGVWMDDGRTVVHLGDRLIVDGAEMAIPDLRTTYIYEQARPLRVDMGAAMGDDDARGLLRLCCEVAWANPDRDGRLLAGWMVVAMLCGAMAWRPHLWLVSEAGGGKSWVLDNLIRPILGAMALRVQSKTTEAGIRGELGSDARPLVFDEAETQNDTDRARMQQVLDLARQASSEDGGAIVKGTREGGSRHYHIRSCFAFASINLGLAQAADESRTLVLEIGSGTPEQFATLKRLHAEVMVPGFTARLLSRCLRLLPVIRANAEVLADAISRTGSGRRAGDTLGTVMAGAMSLLSDHAITPAEAERIVAEREWVRETAEAFKPEPEWRRAIQHLMQAPVRVVSANGRVDTFAVGELVGACAGYDEGIRRMDADQALRRMGLRVDGERLCIGNRARAVADAFAATPWATGWLATLARAPGGERGRAVRFTAGYMDRAVALPVALVTGNTE